MAPEQLRCEAVVPASDLYSCGVVLYRMLTGVLPYRAKSINEVLEAHLNAAPEPIDESLDISPATRELVASMLQKKVADRPLNARELLDRIDAHAEGREHDPQRVEADHRAGDRARSRRADVPDRSAASARAIASWPRATRARA